MLGDFLGLVFVKQRHNLAHHDVHGIVAHFLRDRDKFDAVLGELPDIELHLEMIAEEAGKGMDHDHVEGGGLGDACLDHLLEFRTPVVGGRGPRLYIGLDQFVPALRAIASRPACADRESKRHARPAAPSRRAGRVRRALRCWGLERSWRNLITCDQRHGIKPRQLRSKLPIQIGMILAYARRISRRWY